MIGDFTRDSLRLQKISLHLIISLILIVTLVSAPVLGQEGTTIPGSGAGTSGTTQGSGAAATTTSSNGDNCDGSLCHLSNMRQNVRGAIVNTGEAGYNYLKGDGRKGDKELENAKEDLGDAGDSAKSAVNEAPGAWGLLVDMIGKGVSSIIDMFMNVIDGILWAMFSLPAPGQAFDPSTWFLNGTAPLSDNTTNVSNTTIAANNSSNSTENVTTIQPMVEGGGADRSVLPAGLDFNAWWTVVWKVYAGIAGIMSFLLLIMAVFTLSSNAYTPRERNQRLRDTGISFLLVIFGPIIMPAILHLGNTFVAALLPNAAELLNSPGDILKIVSGAGFAALGGHIAMGVIATVLAIATLVGFGQWILTFLLSATWILWAPLYGSQNGTLKAWSRMGFASLGILVGLKIFQALLFRILWMLPVSWNEPAESIVSLLIFPIGLWVIFYKLPKGGLKRAVPSVVSSISTGGSSGGGFTYDSSTDHVYIDGEETQTNNPGSGGDSPDGSSGDGGDGGGGGGGGGTLSFLNPFSSGEEGDDSSSGRSRIRDWAPDALFGEGGNGSTPGEGTNTPDGSSQTVLNSADHDDRSNQEVTPAEAEDARTRVGSRDEEIRPEMAEAVAGEADDIPPEEIGDDPVASEIEDPESIEEADDYTPESGMGPFDNEIPPEVREQIEGQQPVDREMPPEMGGSEPNDMPADGGDDVPVDDEVPPEVRESIEESKSDNDAGSGEDSSTTSEGPTQDSSSTTPQNIPSSVGEYFGDNSGGRVRDRERVNEVPPSVGEFFDSDDNSKQTSSSEMPESVSDFFESDSEGRTRSSGPGFGDGLGSSGESSSGNGQTDSGGE